MIKPLNNNCLVEVIDEYEGVLRNMENENVQKGVLRDWDISPDHITASAGYFIEAPDTYKEWLKNRTGKVVYWQEYADSGSKFVIEGKRYVLVPFYRLIGVEE